MTAKVTKGTFISTTANRQDAQEVAPAAYGKPNDSNRTWRKPKDLKAFFSGYALKHSGENLGRRANPAIQDMIA